MVRSGAGRTGAPRGGAKPIFAPAGALGRGEATLRPGLGRWGGALMFFGPSGAPHAPGRNKYEVWKYIFIDFSLQKKK